MDRAGAEAFVTKHLYVFYCMFARLHAGDNITDSLGMTDSCGTEDAGRSEVGLHLTSMPALAFAFSPGIPAARCTHPQIHMGGCQGPDRLGPEETPLICIPMLSDALSSTFTKARRLM